MISLRRRSIVAAVCGLSLFLGASPTRADHIPFQVGDVFVAVSNGRVQHRDADGTLLETLDTLQGGATTGMAFDVIGNLYVTNFDAGNVRKFSNMGELIGTFGRGYSGFPESILFDGLGNVYVGAVDGDNDIRHFDALGNPLARFDVATEDRGSDWIDLAADQCAMFYTSEGQNVKRFDVCRNTQLPDFTLMPLPDPVAYALRILPSGGVLVANTRVITRLDAAGGLAETYDTPGEDCWFALNLDPDGESFWSADFCSSNVYKFDLQSGEELLTFNTGTNPMTVFGVVVFGEVTVGAPTALRARVGNERVYLEWDSPSEPVDGYTIDVEQWSELVGGFLPIGTTTPPGTLVTSTRMIVTEVHVTPSIVVSLVNDRIYRFTLRATIGGVPGPPSNAVVAVPGAFAALPEPTHPILLLHGFGGSGRTTFEETLDFMVSTLGWTDGGHLLHEGDSLVTAIDPDLGFDANGEFFTVDFGDPHAHYPALPPGMDGLVHQGDEAASFVAFLGGHNLNANDIGNRFPLDVVAHSNGGLAGRAFLVNHTAAAQEDVASLITYGTPHRGADIDSLVEIKNELLELLGAGSVAATILSGRVAILFGFVSFEEWVNDYVDRLQSTQGARDAALLGCDEENEPELSEFLELLNATPLPATIDYTSIVGHDHSLFFLGVLGPVTLFGHRLEDCHEEHWDGLVPTSSADLNEAGVTADAVRRMTTSRFHAGQGNDFAAILWALDPHPLSIEAMSPVDIEVTAPDGRSISGERTSIPGAAYSEFENSEAHTTIIVLVPFPLAGDYEITVTPKPGASLSDVYSLTVTIGETTTVLVDNQQLGSIPPEPFVASVPERVATVDVDIKPGGDLNSVNVKNRGVIPVAILTTSTFDATTVDSRSVVFGPSRAREAHGRGHISDADGDGDLDMLLHFNNQDTGIVCRQTSAALTGETIEGNAIEGSDSILTVGCR